MSDTAQNELMQFHIGALFTFNPDSSLAFLNETFDQTKPAPKMFFGHTLGGHTTCKFRNDVSAEVKDKIVELCKAEPVFADDGTVLKERMQKYLDLLDSREYKSELCFFVPELKLSEKECTVVFQSNIDSFDLGEFGWLKDEIAYSQPCVVYVCDGRVTSVCRSVRISSDAHEAGIETAKEFRGNNYAAKTLAAWAQSVREHGATPLFSTSFENAASLRVAQKASMYNYGVGVSIL